MAYSNSNRQRIGDPTRPMTQDTADRLAESERKHQLGLAAERAQKQKRIDQNAAYETSPQGIAEAAAEIAEEKKQQQEIAADQAIFAENKKITAKFAASHNRMISANQGFLSSLQEPVNHYYPDE